MRKFLIFLSTTLSLSYTLALSVSFPNKTDEQLVFKANNMTIGDLPLKDYEKMNGTLILNKIFKLNISQIHYVKVESDLEKLLDMEMHPFIEAIHLAYINHLPLIISPDIIWYMISSGTAAHINLNSEQLRFKFVEHEGKKEIVVRRDDFVFGLKTNPWHEVIDEFSRKINENTKVETAGLFHANFSTTSQESRVVSQLVLMDSMKKYFEYTFVSLCGIPEFKILGKKEDWQEIKQRISKLRELIEDLNIWYDQLDKIVDKFIEIYDNEIDLPFWNQIYKVQGGSGGPYLSGWSITFFPYLKNNTKNYYVWQKTWRDAYNSRDFGGLVTNDFTVQLNQIPFKWKSLSNEYEMVFIGGLLGLDFDDVHKSIKPVFGYSVYQSN